MAESEPSVSLSDQPTGALSGRRYQRARSLIVVVVVLVVTSLVVTSVILLKGGGSPAGPSSFAPGSEISRASPGSTGCRQIPMNVCYSWSLTSQYGGKTYSDLTFNVQSLSTSYSQAPSVPLGPGANVSILNSTGGLVAVWNISSDTWVSGATLPLPVSSLVALVLDTGLNSTQPLSNTEWWVSLSGVGEIWGPLQT
jgi:hypothetical protein